MTVRISELNELSTGLSQSDLLPVVDVSASETKKIQIASLVTIGISGAPSSFIDLAKLNQASATKLSYGVLANTGVASGIYGSASTVSRIAISEQGVVTFASGIPIVIPAASVTGLATVATSGTYASLSGLPTLGTLSSQNAGAIAVSGGTISGVTFFSGNVTISGGTISGITDLAVTDGGTGASTASGARTNLGLAIGTDVQAYSAVLSGIGAQFTSADQTIYASSSGVVASTAFTALARSITAQSAASGVRSVLGLGTISTQAAGAVAISGGTISGITDLAVADGGTGASNAADARSNLGLVIGTNVQAYDAGLASIAGLTTGPDQLIYTTSGDSYATTSFPSFSRTLIASGSSAADARNVLGLGSLATLGSVDGINITPSTISGNLLASGTITSREIGAGAVVSGSILAGNVVTVALADDAVTSAKLANQSSTVVAIGAPVGSGLFIGQQHLDTATKYEYTWDGSAWQRQAAINAITINDTTPLDFAVSYPDLYSATITASLANQSANSVFVGPASGSAAAPSFRALTGSDLPLATSGTVGAVRPGAGLSVSAAGALNHSNTVAAGSYVGGFTIDAQGHIVTAKTALQASDIPNIDASKITTGQFTGAFLAPNSVTASQLADYGIAQVSESAPVPEFAGQWWINPNDRSAYIWVGTVTPTVNGYWLNLGYGSPTQINLRFGGTYNASGNTVASINSYGIEAGLTVGQGLSAPNTSNNGIYLICTSSGVGTSPAPSGSLSIGNWVLSQGVGATWTKVALSSAIAGVADEDVLVNPSQLNPVPSGIASQQDFNQSVWPKVQIATVSTTGIVRASTEVVVASGTGVMSLGTIDDGTY